MKILINSTEYIVDDSQRLNVTSLEAEIYSLTLNKLLKKYYLSENIETERKINVLCSLSSYFESEFGADSIAYPLDCAYEFSNGKQTFCGFTMNYFSNCYTMDKASFNLYENNYLKRELTDDKAVSIIYNLFKLLDSIHYKRIILGDIKPSNILIDSASFKPVIIDFDSAQVPPNFPCTAISEQYLDPKIEQQGKNANGYYTVSTDSDIYSLAIVAYEFLVGTLPFDIAIEPALAEIDAKNQGINLLVFHKHKLNRLRNGFELQKNENCLLSLKRLDFIEQNYKELYEFLCTILVFDKRQYLVRNKRVKPSLNHKHGQRVFQSMEKQYNKKDPKELQELVKCYNLSI